MKLEDVITIVHARLDGFVDRETATNIARETVKALGLEVAADGEVYSPAPDPAKGWEAPRMTRVRRRR